MSGHVTRSNKQHHYLAQTYLKGFSDGKNVWCARRDQRGRVFAAPPRKVAKRRGYYGLPDGWDDDPEALESRFSDIEGRITPVLRALRPEQPLGSIDDIAALMDFVAISFARVPAEREHWKRQYLQSIERSAMVMNAHTGSTHPTSGYEIEGNTDIGMLVSNADALYHWIKSFRPCFYFSEKPAFLTSDRPVALVYEADEERTAQKAAFMKEVGGIDYDPGTDMVSPKRLRQVQMPLTAKCLLVLDARVGPRVAMVEATSPQVASFNRDMVQRSDELFGWERGVVVGARRHWDGE